jgi:hypothetical protein
MTHDLAIRKGQKAGEAGFSATDTVVQCTQCDALFVIWQHWGFRDDQRAQRSAESTKQLLVEEHNRNRNSPIHLADQHRITEPPFPERSAVVSVL